YDAMGLPWRSGRWQCRRAAAQTAETDPFVRRLTASRRQLSGGTSIADIARRFGMSREGYTRSFTRLHGISPHAYVVARRLNHARLLLRGGQPIASAAQEAGFSDQSHLGRLFFAAFGTSPARYGAAYA
ncbi:helix-turn-helix domain-containing protein, partial [Amorphus sp. 3PC139-8]|uniref:helix-turn-helix domain-containing protein n=1 Tax=Amorphus sp. 3PC139-8 TaxID=2735676 RepID=UPI00345D495B